MGTTPVLGRQRFPANVYEGISIVAVLMDCRIKLAGRVVPVGRCRHPVDLEDKWKQFLPGPTVVSCHVCPTIVVVFRPSTERHLI